MFLEIFSSKEHVFEVLFNKIKQFFSRFHIYAYIFILEHPENNDLFLNRQNFEHGFYKCFYKKKDAKTGRWKTWHKLKPCHGAINSWLPNLRMAPERYIWFQRHCKQLWVVTYQIVRFTSQFSQKLQRQFWKYFHCFISCSVGSDKKLNFLVGLSKYHQ